MNSTPFYAIRAWSANQSAPEPECGWTDISSSGFCALHALAEEEERVQSLPGFAWWTARALVAVRHGADPLGAEFEMNNTPLHWCAWHAAPGCARALLDAGADWRRCNRAEESAEAVCRRLLRTENPLSSRMQRMSLLLDLLVTAREREALTHACGLAPLNQKDKECDGGRL